MHKIINGVQVPLTAEEIAQRQAEETAWNAGAKDRAVAELRAKRDRLLAKDDWRVIKAKETGSTLSAGFKTYRQALRDLPSTVTDEMTAEDVNNIQFPTE
jgi:cell division GTPase FtsZ